MSDHAMPGVVGDNPLMPRHWDDLELLRTIDRLEHESPGLVCDGRSLMEEVAGEPVPEERDQIGFVHELHLARDAGHLTLQPVVWSGMPPPDPGDPNMYLQRTTEFALTLSGRDRARGRVIEVPMPVPDEDDGRPVGLMTIEEIARAIGDAYIGEQLPRFLEDSGLPREAIQPFEGTKWRYIASLLTALLEGGAAARRSVREFLGAWLDNRLHSGPTHEEQARIVHDLARQGWHVHDGQLVIGDRIVAEPVVATLAGEATLTQLHPRVRDAAEPLYRDGHRSAAVFEAYKTIEQRVRELTNRTESARALMASVFDQDAPLLSLNDGANISDRDEQEGFKLLYMGAMQGVRNPKAHDLFDQLAEERALDYLAAALRDTGRPCDPATPGCVTANTACNGETGVCPPLQQNPAPWSRNSIRWRPSGDGASIVLAFTYSEQRRLREGSRPAQAGACGPRSRTRAERDRSGRRAPRAGPQCG